MDNSEGEVGLGLILRSIKKDTEWISQLHNSLPHLGIVTNQRCGSWYVPPELVSSSCYFKSTDGHPIALQQRRMFGLRRLNLHLLQSCLLDQFYGLIIVDSTKNSKKLFPDAFTRTFPVWCHLINTLALRYGSITHIPPFKMHDTISSEELDTVKGLLDVMVEELEHTLGLGSPETSIGDIKKRLSGIKKPFQVLWCDRKSSLQSISELIQQELDRGEYYPILLTNPSSVDSLFDGYIKGAADDEETWAFGLTPELFWEYTSRTLLLPSKCDIDKLLLKSANESRKVSNYQYLEMGCQNIHVNSPRYHYVGSLNSVKDKKKLVIDFSPTSNEPHFVNSTYIHLPVGNYKKYRHALEGVLQQLFIAIDGKVSKIPIVLWSIPDYNVSLAACLAILLQFYSLQGMYNKLRVWVI